MTWMVTGGAGYIGANIVRSLLDSGRDVVVLDDLSTGESRKVPSEVPLVTASVADRAAVTNALQQHKVTGVVHMAAKKAAGESVERPLHYYRENVDGMLSLLESMHDVGVGRIVYSSSAATFGTPDVERVTEQSPCLPESPYGETKLIGEWLLRDVERAGDLDWVSLRYFNVAGAGSPELGDTGAFNLIPMVFKALTDGKRPQVFGDDYATPDGSCVRDYIHVTDLADAHVAAVARLEKNSSSLVLNVGRGEGVSVKEVMSVVKEVTGQDFSYDVVARRPGDPARIVATAELVASELKWSAKYDLTDMVRSAWDAWQAHPPQ